MVERAYVELDGNLPKMEQAVSLSVNHSMTGPEGDSEFCFPSITQLVGQKKQQ